MDFADYRPYVPGDDYRRIDHNMRARLGVTLVRLFESEDELPVRLVIDRSASMAFESKMGAARQLAAAVAFTALAGGDRVIPMAVPGVGGRPIERAKSGSHLVSWPAIEAWLEGLTPEGTAPSGDVLRRVILEGGVRGPVVLVSDLMVPGWQELITGVGVASGGLVIHILGPSEVAPDIAGDVRVVDSETGDEVDVSATRGALTTYAARYQEFVTAAAGLSRRSGLDYIQLVAGPDVLGRGLDALAGTGVIA